MNNLILAKEHISQWKPHLVIADLYGFLNDALPEQPINAFFAACRMTPLVLLQSGNMPYRPQYASQVRCYLNTPYMSWHNELKERYIPSTAESAGKRHAIALSAGGKVPRCGRSGTSTKRLRMRLGIHGKTVSTYKRNIRMKLRYG